MRRLFLPFIVLLMSGCSPDFEPDLSGWKAYTHPARRIHLEVNGKEQVIQLPGDESIGYRYPQLTKSRALILVTQLIETGGCINYQVVSADSTGAIVDTVYTAPPSTPINFKLAPNDSLLLVKTYDDNCNDVTENFRYTFYNRFLKKGLEDTVKVRRARGIPIIETVWSPDSKRVIISEYSGQQIRGFIYNLATKDTIHIDKGSNFVWSPTDNNLVAYIKDNSIYTMKVGTGEREVLFEGETKRGAADFRWDPTGEFLMIHLRRYLLNIESKMTRSTTVLYFSVKEKRESRVHYDDRRIDTWKSSEH